MSLHEAVVCNIQRFSSEDGPGIRTTLFFKGCPMRCPWCQNPESLSLEPELVWHGGRCLHDHACTKVCPTSALAFEPVVSGTAVDAHEHMQIVRVHCDGCGRCVETCASFALELLGRRYTVRNLFDLCMRDAVYYDTSGGGVTLSGGEPLSQPEVTLELLAELKSAHVHTALDTCGAGPLWALDSALKHVDLVLFDVKSVEPQAHREWTGVEFDRVVEAAQLVNKSGVPVWVRTPVIPGYTAREDTIRAIARFVANTFEHCERHDLLAFSNLCAAKYSQLDRQFALQGVPLLDSGLMDHFCAVATEAGSKAVRWSGPCAVPEGVS